MNNMNFWQHIMHEFFSWNYVAIHELPIYRPNEWYIYRLYKDSKGKEYIKTNYSRIAYLEYIKTENWKYL